MKSRIFMYQTLALDRVSPKLLLLMIKTSAVPGQKLRNCRPRNTSGAFLNPPNAEKRSLWNLAYLICTPKLQPG
jgi:hypothetical protein